MTIVLVHPEIPQNTGTIARLCAVTGATLELVHPLGFKTDDKHLRRAGLDYWHAVDICEHAHLRAFLEERARLLETGSRRFFYLSRRGGRWYSDVQWRMTDFMVFGAESSGLDLAALNAPDECVLRIPQRKDQRCLNLANAVSIVLYEALRQQRFPELV